MLPENSDLYPSSEEESLKFWLFPHDDNGKLVEKISELEDICSIYLSYIHPLIQDYIWFDEKIVLKVTKEESNEISGN